MNKLIRNALKEKGLRYWQLADLMGIAESTLTRKLRHELPEDEQQRILDLIREGVQGNGE